jgi:hypothetical protein
MFLFFLFFFYFLIYFLFLKSIKSLVSVEENVWFPDSPDFGNLADFRTGHHKPDMMSGRAYF